APVQQPAILASVDAVLAALASRKYIADRGLATAIFLALRRHKPLLLEGEPGVGKTEVARVLADILGTHLIRLQCYEGIDQATAVYEWNYARQLLYIRLLEAGGQADLSGPPRAPSDPADEGDQSARALRRSAHIRDVFGPDFLIRRPLLEALDTPGGHAPVLLIDELDRSDAEFEAYLLELLSDYQITIPEIGVLRAEQPPVVVLTSNRTRDIHDALRRRCLYYWIEYPTFEKEYAIVRARAPEAPDMLARQVVAFAQAVRGEDLFKAPGVAETLDWLVSLVTLGQTELSEQATRDSLGALLKYQDDMQKVTTGSLLTRLLERARGAMKHG
ncbi:MAG TPA: MoxR family ATPase, partial [Ktedonobacterales bacterium]|nr:MoxR family ATPase [Ktedonobacterales bacterium]